MKNELRGLLSVEKLLQTRNGVDLINKFGRPLTIEAIRITQGDIRSGENNTSTLDDLSAFFSQVQSNLIKWTTPSLNPVINATGVILHTNLGRAPLCQSAIHAISEIGDDYSTLEYEIGNGRRGSRSGHVEELIKRLTGAESVLVVNNNAGAVLLVLSVLAKRKRVIISRTQLVEIGGGFRIPEVLGLSGAKLFEIGTTNKVNQSDYIKAFEAGPAIILNVHKSNFKIVGFTSEPSVTEIAKIAHEQGTIFIDDLGSGTLLETERYGLGHEPMVQESINKGADIVCFSGDKLLGGPQAGIIIGKQDLISKCKRHPLARALRTDKLCLAALSATLLHYLKDEAESKIPIWQMISKQLHIIEEQANSWVDQIGFGSLIDGQSTVGGGSLPGEILPTVLFAINSKKPDNLLKKLRMNDPPVIARIQDDQVVFDPRTVLEGQDVILLKAICKALHQR